MTAEGQEEERGSILRVATNHFRRLLVCRLEGWDAASLILLESSILKHPQLRQLNWFEPSAASTAPGGSLFQCFLQFVERASADISRMQLPARATATRSLEVSIQSLVNHWTNCGVDDDAPTMLVKCLHAIVLADVSPVAWRALAEFTYRTSKNQRGERIVPSLLRFLWKELWSTMETMMSQDDPRICSNGFILICDTFLHWFREDDQPVPAIVSSESFTTGRLFLDFVERNKRAISIDWFNARLEHNDASSSEFEMCPSHPSSWTVVERWFHQRDAEVADTLDLGLIPDLVDIVTRYLQQSVIKQHVSSSDPGIRWILDGMDLDYGHPNPMMCHYWGYRGRGKSYHLIKLLARQADAVSDWFGEAMFMQILLDQLTACPAPPPRCHHAHRNQAKHSLSLSPRSSSVSAVQFVHCSKPRSQRQSCR